MLDMTSRDTLPMNDAGKVALDPAAILASVQPANMGSLLNSGVAWAGDEPNDYNTICKWLRSNFQELCRAQLENFETYGENRWGDDPGDYAQANGELLSIFQDTWGMAMWHTELVEEHIYELNRWLNCDDEEHCIHQFSVDGPSLPLEALAVEWEQCPLMQD